MKMTSIGKLALAFTAAATLALPAVADAATYVSKLEYRDGLVGPQTPYGLVTLEEINATTVKVTVTLTDAASLFINTGGPHDPFLFNTVNNDTVVVQSPIDTFYNAGRGTFNATPFGNFTNKIGCCNDKNGQSKGETPPLIFTVSNASGLTFAGLNATFDGNGKLLTQGTGDHFTSNTGGWWFSADIYDGATGKTYNVAAKDAFVQTTVPEPATWAMMIMGFGAAGAVLRRRRQMATA
jgi:hypothetical protein